MNSFYLTLPSNSSFQYFPDNTLAHFTTHLPHAINLEGAWEIGLAEIQYPHNWYNVKAKDAKKDVCVKVKHPPAVEIIETHLEDGLYEDPQQFVGTLDRRLADMIMRSTETTPVFQYGDTSQRATVAVPEGTKVELSQPLQSMLGMEQCELEEGQHTGTKPVDLQGGFYSLYIYCDLLEPRIVGDAQVPLLRIVPIEGTQGQMVTKTYENLQYIPMLKKNFRTVELYIMTDTGELVAFNPGKLVITLHFRRKRHLL